jgi:hypothetical protein
MNLSPLLASLEGMADIDARQRKLEDLIAFRAKAFKEDEERFAREEARFAEKCAEADAAFEERPRRHHRGAPDPEERRSEVERFIWQRRALDEERAELIGQHADMLTAQLLDLEADALAKAQQAVAVLDQAAVELESLRSDLRKVNRYSNRADRTGGGNVDVYALVDAVHVGTTFLAPTEQVEIIHVGGMTAVKRTPIPRDDGLVLRHKGVDYRNGARVASDG